MNALHSEINRAQTTFQAGVDDDWRRSCLKYPEVLDYYFSLVEVGFPDDRDAIVSDPRFGGSINGTRKLKARRDSSGHRKKDRRRSSRGRTPPAVPMASSYQRR